MNMLLLVVLLLLAFLLLMAFLMLLASLLGCYSETQVTGRSILSWSVILSVYGADTIAIDLSLSVLIS
jgi:hypothetical protein